MDLFDIAAKITLNTSDYEKDLSGAEKSGSTFSEKLKSGLKTAAKVGTAAVAAVGSGVVALGSKFVSGISDIAAYGDEIDKNSQKMGISAEAYQKWDFVLQHSGSSIDAMSRGMMTLSKQAEGNNEAFAALGITEEDLASLNKEDLFAKTIEGLQQMEEGTERDTLASKLFGGAAKELGPLLNTSADDVADMFDQVEALGGVMGDDAVKNAAAFQDSLQNLKTVISGIKNSFLKDFLPAATKVMNGLTAIFGGDSKSGVGQIKEGITEIVNSLTEKIPEFLDIGWGIVDALLTAISDNLPMLIEKGADLLLNGIIPGIIDKLPFLVETAFTIIAQLVNSIAAALPELIPAAVSMILQIVESLLDNIDMLIDAAIALIIGLADGIIKAVPILIEKAPIIIAKLVDAIIRNIPKIFAAAKELITKFWESIKDNLPKLFDAASDIINAIGNGIARLWDMVKDWGKGIIDKIWSGLKDGIEKAKTWGKDLIDNFGKGITEKAQALLDKVKSVASSIKSFLGFSEPEKGPLSDFHTYAPDMMNLFMRGIEDNKRKLERTVADAFDFGGIVTDPNGWSGVHRPAAAVAGAGFSGTIDLYIDKRTLVGSTSKEMDRSLGDIDKFKMRYGGR